MHDGTKDLVRRKISGECIENSDSCMYYPGSFAVQLSSVQLLSRLQLFVTP